MKKKIFSFLFLLSVIISMCIPASAASTEPSINILINGTAVQFTEDTGYPYIDENSRTMVPLRATMESAGFVVGYDSAKQTAIVITENCRIEVPLYTDLIYCNRETVQNDTIAVINNNRTYLPIRAVLEAAGFTVEWDGNTQTVNAHSFDYASNELLPYQPHDVLALIDHLLSGEAIYIDGQYYLTPEYIKMMNTVEVHYFGNDLNTAILPEQDRYSLADYDTAQLMKDSLDNAEWIKDSDLYLYDETLNFGYVPVSGGLAYGFFYSNPLSGTVSDYFILTDLPLDAGNSDRFAGTYSNIQIQRKDGAWYFYLEDLKSAGIIK